MKIKNCLQSLILALVPLLSSVQDSQAVEESFTIYNPSIVHDTWFGSYYYRDGRNNDVLKVGGWGDVYSSIIRMPVNVSVPPRIFITRARLFLYSYGSTRPTSMKKYFILENWNESSTTDHWGLDLGTVNHDSLPAPSANGEYVIDITAEFSLWISGQYANYGIMLVPENVDNRFNHFLSSENSRGFGKPRIVVDYERLPDFKLPLPGGIAWRLTVEAGGKQFDKQTELDDHHTGNTYYSLDFNREWVNLSGGSFSTANDVPIYAAASGKVVESTYTDANGWYVKIDHDNDGNVNTGFQTVYIHLKDPPLVSVNNHVSQGRQIGIMGESGIYADGIHLHMTFYYRNQGGNVIMGYDSPYLNALRMEGKSIKNYKLGTTWNSGVQKWTPYMAFPSSNSLDLD